ncbi:MAG TPA: transglutaminase family protein [Chthonomonadaceae bacterium]|nr:transglutaminase family protein [Chthonomonadaceae bacterium]
MILRIGYEIVFELPAPTPMVLILFVHPSLTPRLRQPERLSVEPEIAMEDYIDSFGNHCARILAPPGRLRLWYDNEIEDSGLPEPAYPYARQHPIEELPSETLQFLLASRYCEVDRLSEVAWSLFGQTSPGWARVQAVCDWVYAHVEFGYPYARATRTAYEVYEERKGVCRDFMHLAVTFCRCLGIPARYATGYLGDIGVAPSKAPMDFSAFFEVYLEGQWHPFDARHNARRIGRVLMARGRDAADVALTTSFGVADLKTFRVWTKAVSGA